MLINLSDRQEDYLRGILELVEEKGPTKIRDICARAARKRLLLPHINLRCIRLKHSARAYTILYLILFLYYLCTARGLEEVK